MRHSPDKVQYIGCTIQSNGVGVGRSALCEAMNADGERRSCTTVEPEKVDVLSTLDHNAQLSFSWNKSGVCTHVAVDK